MACSSHDSRALQCNDQSTSGPLTVLVAATLMSAILTYGWPFAADFAGFAVVAPLVGYVFALVASD